MKGRKEAASVPVLHSDQIILELKDFALLYVCNYKLLCEAALRMHAEAA